LSLNFSGSSFTLALLMSHDTVDKAFLVYNWPLQVTKQKMFFIKKLFYFKN